MTDQISGTFRAIPPRDWDAPENAAAAAVDYMLVRQIRDAVNDQLSEWSDTLEQRPTRIEERRRAEDLITNWLENQMMSSVASGVPLLTAVQEQALRAATMADMFGLGRLEALLAQEDIEDIYIVGTRPVTVKLSDGRRELREPIAATNADLMKQLEAIATHHGQTSRSVTTARPWLNMRLPGQARLAAMWEVTPVPFITIRRHRFVDARLQDLVTMGMLSPAMAAFLTAAVRAKRSILVVGGQGSGKTTFLRCLCREIPDTERYVTLESEFELLLHELDPPPPGVFPVEEREGLGELGRDGRPAGEVTINLLFPETLRHTQDRMVMGEIRDPAAARAALKAMTRGYKGSMATFHAESAAETVMAMATLLSEDQANWSLESARHQFAMAVDLIVFVDKEPIRGRADYRYVSHIVEVNGVSEKGVVSQTEIFAPLDEMDGTDYRGYPAGQPTDPRWLRRVGFDPAWWNQGGWTEAFPTPMWEV